MATEDVRLAVYRAFARTGQAPTTQELAAHTGMEPHQVAEALQDLHRTRDLVLDGSRIVMAHPFASIPLGFSVMGERTLWWGGCAWDSFAIAHLVEPDVLVATRCPGCGAAHAWNVSPDRAPVGGQVAHFLTPTKRIWDDVVRACEHQRIFCSEECVDQWLSTEGLPRGYVMDLETLWRLARGWYAGRLERGYVRREPTEAAAYFAEVGLRGPFWGMATDRPAPG
jgi:hypothetical protein